MPDSESVDRGSIPLRDTNERYLPSGRYFSLLTDKRGIGPFIKNRSCFAQIYSDKAIKLSTRCQNIRMKYVYIGILFEIYETFGFLIKKLLTFLAKNSFLEKLHLLKSKYNK